MDRGRLLAVLGLDYRFTLKRPMLWALIFVVGLLTWGLSTGTVRMSSGAVTVGGTQAWITSESSAAFMLSMLIPFLYGFFASIAAGMAVISDDEKKVSEVLMATRLRAGEYVWGKALALIAAFLTVLAVQFLFMGFFFHVLPNPSAEEIQGPFRALNYLRPMVVFGLPSLLLFIGVPFYLGVRFRRPVLTFLFPLAFALFCGFFLWNWTPTWLDPAINRLLMWLDPAGVRWLSETWLKVDRGAEFYNSARVELDGPFLLSRLVFVGLGLLAIFAAQRHLTRHLRGSAAVAREPRRWFGRWRRKAAAPVPVPASAGPLSMSSSEPGFLRATLELARLELGTLLREPALYLFAFFVFVQILGSTLVSLGAFQTPLLLTPGLLAAGSFNTISFLVCLLMMFFHGESLQRERATRMQSIAYSAPAPTAALLAGKALGNSLVAVLILLGTFLAGVIALLVQGQVAPSITPYLLIWGFLLLPTFFAWAAFVSAVYAVSGNRYFTYAVGVAAVAFTLYRQFTGSMNWAGNWWIWSTIRWSDISRFEVDRMAFVLSRLGVLALAVFFLVVAVRFFRRRDLDATRLIHRLRPKPLLFSTLRLAPWAVPALVCGVVLWLSVLSGPQGEAAENDARDYWRQNTETWEEAPQPWLEAVDLRLDLEPAERRLASRGTYRLINAHDEALERFVLTGGSHWRDLGWTLNGDPYEPEERSGLYVFTPPEALAPGEQIRVGFDFHGRFPEGITENGGPLQEFVLPSGVVLTSFSSSFVPILGFVEGRGVDDENRTDPPEYPDDVYQDQLAPAFGSGHPFTTRLEISIPEDFTVNGVGTLEREEVADGRRTSLWVSDHPVRFFNVVAGRWQVERGEGTAIYYFPEHAYNVAEMSKALDAARRRFSEWFHPFPWRELKISEFPALATYAQGFPTNITFSEGIGFLTRSDARNNAVRMVTAHEAAHQWWGNLLTPGDGPGGNVLSEGMSHFSTVLLLEDLGGQRARMEFLKRIEERYESRRRKDAERPLVKLDGSQPGDTTATYDKGGWVAYMLLRQMGREAMLEGLRHFIATYKDGPDYPLLEDMVETLRPFAADPAGFDRFVEQWFFEVVVPEYRLRDARREGSDGSYRTTVRIENIGSGRMPVQLAAVAGERFDEAGEALADYRESRISLELGAGDVQEVTIHSSFAPERLVLDPDVEVLQLRRQATVIEL